MIYSWYNKCSLFETITVLCTEAIFASFQPRVLPPQMSHFFHILDKNTQRNTDLLAISYVLLSVLKSQYKKCSHLWQNRVVWLIWKTNKVNWLNSNFLSKLKEYFGFYFLKYVYVKMSYNTISSMAMTVIFFPPWNETMALGWHEWSITDGNK